jgi:ABC-type antimicrobial peptide transport system permease subunit
VTVVGVSADVVQYLDVADPDPLLFLPYRQEGYSWMALMVRTTGAPTAVTGAIRAELQRLDQDLPLFDVLAMRELERGQRWYLRVFGVVFLTFAAIALLLASIGIYAVVAQTTGRRTQEIGVRIALGATAGSIVRTMMARGTKQLAAGLVLGLAGAVAATRLLTSVLVRVSPTDPVVFVSVTLVLVGIGLFACWLPARRAAALHPVKALRYE